MDRRLRPVNVPRGTARVVTAGLCPSHLHKSMPNATAGWLTVGKDAVSATHHVRAVTPPEVAARKGGTRPVCLTAYTTPVAGTATSCWSATAHDLDRPARLLVAAWLGETRLIDNVRILPRQSIDGFSRNPGIATARQHVP